MATNSKQIVTVEQPSYGGVQGAAKLVLLLFFTVIVASLCSCESEGTAWKATQKVATTGAYEKFLEKYPNGQFVEQAKSAYWATLYEQHVAINTTEAINDYLALNPPAEYVDRAEAEKERLRLMADLNQAYRARDVVNRGRIDDDADNAISVLEQFTSTYPTHEFVSEATFLLNVYAKIKDKFTGGWSAIGCFVRAHAVVTELPAGSDYALAIKYVGMAQPICEELVGVRGAIFPDNSRFSERGKRNDLFNYRDWVVGEDVIVYGYISSSMIKNAKEGAVMPFPPFQAVGAWKN